MDEVFGIDLGTTNSCIAVLDPVSKLPIVIPNTDNAQTLPSVVYFESLDSPIVGLTAVNARRIEPERIVAYIKREMSNPNYHREIDGMVMSPVRVSAIILKKLIDDANYVRSLSSKAPISHAVITVPAYFGNDERSLTRQAAMAAGLTVDAILNEPTAAALSFASQANYNLEGKTFMVYDLGGGTFDVSILRMQRGQLTTLATDGNHHLGGLDWDTMLARYALSKVDPQTQWEEIVDNKDGARIILAAENCKKQLSRADSASIRFQYQQRTHNIAITRAEFEALTQHLLNQTLNVTRQALAMTRNADPGVVIDQIILVGGSSYMPMVRQALTHEFPKTQITLENFEPDLAVAKGAAIHGGNPQAIVDRNSRSYGMEVVGTQTGKTYISNLILRTDPMRFKAQRRFVTPRNNVSSLSISIFENLSDQKRVNFDTPEMGINKIISGEVSWGVPVAANTNIQVDVDRDENGLVSITVECQNHRKTFRIEPETMLAPPEYQSLRQYIDHLQLT